MDLVSAIKVLLRRWVVLLIGIVLTLGVSAYLYTTTPPSYTVGAKMLLLLPNNARGSEAVGSPFLYLPSGLDVIAGLVAGAPATRAFQQAKAAEGLDAGVSVGVDTRSPMLVIAVTGEDPDDVLATRDWVVTTLQEELRQIQVEEGAPPSQVAHGRVFGAENVPRVDDNHWMKPVLVVVAVGGVVTLIAAFSIDYLLRSRSRRRAMRAWGQSPSEEADGKGAAAEQPAPEVEAAHSEECSQPA